MVTTLVGGAPNVSWETEMYGSQCLESGLFYGQV